MNNPLAFEPGMEPERYELDEAPANLDLDRRDFCQILGGVLVLLLHARSQAQQRGRRRFGRGRGRPLEISAWLRIGEEGDVTVYTGKVEVGQNIRTSLTQVVAEELHVATGAIRMVMADTQLTPFDAGTFGSRTTPDMALRLRRVAAATRELLIDLAAEHWNVDRAVLTAAGGRIVHSETQESLGYGTLAGVRELTKTVLDDTPTTPSARWTVAGRSEPKVSARDIVTGRHRYSSDMRLEGMLHGKVLRQPSFGATLRSVDTSKAEAMPEVVVVRDDDFVGVVAPTELAAEQALRAIQADWTAGREDSGDELYDRLRQTSGGGRGRRGGRGNTRSGSIEEGLAAADVRRKATYNIAYIAHAPLEPRAGVARWENGKLTVWTGTQRPFGVRGDLASSLGIDLDDVRVIVPDTGSGYGGKHTSEAAVEAARLARAAGGPVKVVWSREEEFTWAYFRPAGVIDIASGARKDGTLTAWEFHNYNSGASAIRTLYEVPNQRVEFHRSNAPLRQGSYRALASTANVFARETHMDELAHALEMEPLEFRLNNLKDARLRAVFEAAAAKFGWGSKPPPGHGYGIGGGFEKGSYVATCAEVAVDRSRGRVRVVRAVSAFECGTVLNPNHLKNQVEGSLMMGLGGALFESIKFDGGKILNPRFSQYRVPRFSDAPSIEVVLLDRKDLPSAGAGETPIIGIAPAIGNAIFSATGVRLRSLPLESSLST